MCLLSRTIARQRRDDTLHERGYVPVIACSHTNTKTSMAEKGRYPAGERVCACPKHACKPSQKQKEQTNKKRKLPVRCCKMVHGKDESRERKERQATKSQIWLKPDNRGRTTVNQSHRLAFIPLIPQPELCQASS